MTAEPVTAEPDQLRTIAVRRIPVRVSVRPATGHLADVPPLLLCNGIGASLEALQPLVDELDPARGLVRFDVPGVGGSPPPPFPYTMAGLASWLGAMMTRLGHPTYDVLGLSWGGGVAQQLAFQQRRRVRRVVLAATGTGSLMVPARPRVLGIMLTPRRHRDPDYAARVAATIYGGSMRTDPERGARLLHSVTRAGPQRGYYLQLLAGAGWSSLPGLPLIRQPVLVLAGDDDPIIPLVNAKVIARLLPRSTLHVYRGGHLGILTEADRLAPVIETFLQESLR
ncbi:poly(3-hydroxyalkanoate) depolymerase [Nocardioides rubriscoriae]|uniref:poly(3-hydroxyalkanoate) depolymerase n=1 Tax=Nocardioides rubriscoriae TaxID=642762 RepID=UPI0011DFF8AE|nr:poly(3-hydroxyalkanoate) depolymerase [Nocardioides rubriscoriae]